MKYFIGDAKYYWNKIFATKYQSNGLKEIRKNGILVIEKFLSEESCDYFKESINKLLSENKATWQDKTGSDCRIFGFEKLDSRSENIFESINHLYQGYIDTKVNNSFLMANRVKYVKNNLGSGGGWHRDSLNRRQLKFMIYLSDVSTVNGAFEYLPRTHSASNKFFTNKFLTKKVRYTQDEIDGYLKKFPSKTFTGKKGTCIIFDSSGLHRGNPIEEGTRYAITKYMYDSKIPAHMKRLISD